MTTSIRIEAGTKVGGVHRGQSFVVELLAPVYTEAERTEDGCWTYQLGAARYYCAGGLATVV